MSNTLMSRSSNSLGDGNVAGNDQGFTMQESTAVPLVKRVTCPHCWHEFRPDQILWVSQHEELMGDAVLKEEGQRFLPTRFTLEGQAIDARGMVCSALACPSCHLVLPRVLIENEVTFISIIGSAGSGKSNFLATMTWELRQTLAKDFAIIFADGDKEANWILNRYEETLFLPEDPERPVVLDKTRTQGDLYRSLTIAGQETQLPKPFLFSLHPGAEHPRAKYRARLGRIVCLYDNSKRALQRRAGYGIEPGDSASFPLKSVDVPAGPDAGSALPCQVQRRFIGPADRRTGADSAAGEHSLRGGHPLSQTCGIERLSKMRSAVAGARGEERHLGAARAG